MPHQSVSNLSDVQQHRYNSSSDTYVRLLEACLNCPETRKFCGFKDKSVLHAGSSSISRRIMDFSWSETVCAAWGRTVLCSRVMPWCRRWVHPYVYPGPQLVRRCTILDSFAWTVSLFEVRGRSGFLDGPLALFGRIRCCSNDIRC